MVTQGHDPAGQADRADRSQLVLGGGGEPLVERAGPVGDGVAAAERVDPPLPQSIQLGVSLADLLVAVVLAHAS